MVIGATGTKVLKVPQRAGQGKNVPISLASKRRTLVNVSMYVDILSSALDDWVTDLSGPDLIEYAVLCRDELRAVAPPHGGSAYTALAAEIAYDRALIALCTERGIDAHATSFSYPVAERRRIESVLRQLGVDLDSLRLGKGGAEVPIRREPEDWSESRPDRQPPLGGDSTSDPFEETRDEIAAASVDAADGSFTEPSGPDT
jgi:hypothetical protein